MKLKKLINGFLLCLCVKDIPLPWKTSWLLNEDMCRKSILRMNSQVQIIKIDSIFFVSFVNDKIVKTIIAEIEIV
jgi:hypothetical protein